jgi:hypothetical protein
LPDLFVVSLAIAVLHGHQNKKQTIDDYYREYEESFEEADDLIAIFQTVIYELEQLLPDIKTTRWKKKTDFYTLFLYLASHYKKLPFPPETRKNIRITLDSFSILIDKFILGEGDEDNKQVQDYGKSIRASTDLGSRKRRHIALCELIDPILGVNTSSIPNSIVTPLQDGLFDLIDDEDA